MKSRIAFFSGLLCLIFATMAQAAVHGSVWINQPTVGANATIAAAAGLGAADAQFDVGAINFNSDTSGYTIGAFLGNPTFSSVSAGWIAAGGAGQTLNNTYFLFTGSLFLNAGANSFVVPHDDGLQLDIAGIAGFEVDAPGPTAPVNTPFTVIAPSAGSYNFTMSYGEVLGPPAVLAFIVNNVPVGSVPEPESYAMLLAGLGLLGIAARRRKQKSA